MRMILGYSADKAVTFGCVNVFYRSAGILIATVVVSMQRILKAAIGMSVLVLITVTVGTVSMLLVTAGGVNYTVVGNTPTVIAIPRAVYIYIIPA